MLEIPDYRTTQLCMVVSTFSLRMEEISQFATNYTCHLKTWGLVSASIDSSAVKHDFYDSIGIKFWDNA